MALAIIMASSIHKPKARSCDRGDVMVEMVEMVDEKQEKCSYGDGQRDEVVEILMFHGEKRSLECRSIERLAREAVEADFCRELSAGRIKISVVDISTDGGGVLADLYRVASSSLYINKWSEGRELRCDMTRLALAKATRSPEEFKLQLRAKIASLLV